MVLRRTVQLICEQKGSKDSCTEMAGSERAGCPFAMCEMSERVYIEHCRGRS